MGKTKTGSKGAGIPGAGIGERIRGVVDRTTGAVGRAIRGVAGLPEAGTDLLYQVLHAEHEEVNQLFVKILEEEEGARVRKLWQQLALSLTLHARAEQEVVYERLARIPDAEDPVAHGFEEHAEIERLLGEANKLVPGSDAFRRKVTALQDTVRHHVDDEEGQMLPRGGAHLSDPDKEDLVARFRQRKAELEVEVTRELAAAPATAGKRSRLEDDTTASGRAEPKTRRAAPRKGGRRPSASDLRDKTVKELQALAREREIEGRSKMRKDDLVEALSDAPAS